MLHGLESGTMRSCSKAPRGLLVLVWTDGIFTANALSPRPSLRQCPHDYSIRAGQNLPDKEFRYLRTVIVTAAVHRGFSSHREALPLTFRHWAGVSPYTSTFVLAETCVFDKQFRGLFCCSLRTIRTRSSRHLNLENLFKFPDIVLFCRNRGSSVWYGGRPYPEVTVAVLPSSLAKVLS